MIGRQHSGRCPLTSPKRETIGTLRRFCSPQSGLLSLTRLWAQPRFGPPRRIARSTTIIPAQGQMTNSAASSGTATAERPEESRSRPDRLPSQPALGAVGGVPCPARLGQPLLRRSHPVMLLLLTMHPSIQLHGCLAPYPASLIPLACFPAPYGIVSRWSPSSDPIRHQVTAGLRSLLLRGRPYRRWPAPRR